MARYKITMSNHLALRAKVACLRRDNAALRRALKAERKYWKHLLFCADCQLQTVLRIQCPDAQSLRQDYLKRASNAAKR